MNLLALDLGTKTGWCLGGEAWSFSGVLDLKPDRFAGGGMRYVRFQRRLDELHDVNTIDEVVFEEVRRHIGTDAAHVYGGMMATLQAWCEKNAIPYQGVPVGTIKKYATGKGNSPKAVVVAAVRDWGYKPADDNEADAIALFHCWLDARKTAGA